VADVWDPGRYERFRAERKQPFVDLVALLEARPGMRVADLGCGTGDLTLELHQKLQARETVGVDNSPAMLAKAPQAPGLRFELADIERFAAGAPFDLVFSNAALHWVENHFALFERLTAMVAAGGQLAVQMPMNDAHPSHQTAFELARSPEFRRLLGGFEKRPPLAEPAQYATWLHYLGYARQQVHLQIYSHLLDGREQVIDWVRGTLLTDYQKRLAPSDWERFLERYRQLLLPQLSDDKPFFYTYPRLLIWGAKN
jgi:trans-aconitate 2-methyltransferase